MCDAEQILKEYLLQSGVDRDVERAITDITEC